MSAIPLHCNICPKKPKFSDVSHLLTHIASKGHLSHYYKIKVRSSTEEESKILIDAYDNWYTKYKVEDLMAERLSLKDKRRLRAARDQATVNSSSASRNSAARRASRRQVLANQVNSLDPRLNEQLSRIDGKLDQPYYSHYSYSPQACHYPTNGVTPINSHRCGTDHYPGGQFEAASFNNSIDSFSGRSVFDRNTLDISPFTVSVDDGQECTKLKGVFWPGMDVFDSATPEMKRKRNQKKDTSVVAQLESNSVMVEPTELIFTPRGSFKKARKISGNPEDDEDDEDDVSSPIKHEASPILNNTNYSTCLPVGSIQFDISKMTSSSNLNAMMNPPLVSSAPTTLPSVSATASMAQLLEELPPIRSTFVDDRAEFDLSYGGYNPGNNSTVGSGKRKRRFDVYQDREISFGNPAGYGMLNSEFHFTNHSSKSTSNALAPQNNVRYNIKERNHGEYCDPFHQTLPRIIETVHEKENVVGATTVKSQQHYDTVNSYGNNHQASIDVFANQSNSFPYHMHGESMAGTDGYSDASYLKNSSTFFPSYHGATDSDERRNLSNAISETGRESH